MKFFLGFVIGTFAGKPVFKALRTHVLPLLDTRVSNALNNLYDWSDAYSAGHNIQKESTR